MSWSLTRGLLYAIGFLVVMLLLGLVLSPTGILAIPGALLIGLAAASVGMAATTFMRKWQDFDLVAVVTTPMFLFSGTFFPITVYPDWLRIIVELTPLYRGVHMLRSFTTGDHRADGARRRRLPRGHGPHRRGHHLAAPAHPAAEVARPADRLGHLPAVATGPGPHGRGRPPRVVPRRRLASLGDAPSVVRISVATAVRRLAVAATGG